MSIMLQYCFMINFGLMVFNLLPIPPLDGYHVVQCLFMNQRTYRFFNFVEKYSYVILIGVLLLNSRTGFLNALVELVMKPFIALIGLVVNLF